ncbi:hypothetical protein [Oscillibacter sp.]|uniref:hypothetical protein n=1 Tax=Oscillibacter sp. TaxID=1945593 RepID=UPI00262214A0|nr:hypothetical protein [Oscillibacter sp.]MDD3347662.1 hypothetical protein [Oscillibacter sp.]
METFKHHYYDQIPVPDDPLEQVIEKGLRRGTRRRAMRRWASSAATVLLLLLVCANVTPLYAGALEIPVLREMVRILRIGSGGQVPSALVSVQGDAEGSTVALQFTSPKGEAMPVPPYSAKRRLAPSRVVLRLHEIGEEPTEQLLNLFTSMEGVAEAYPNQYSTASDQGITIVLKNGYDCAISEYETPGTLVLEFSKAEATAPQTVYYLRSKAMPLGSDLAALTDRLAWEGATQVRTQDGKYFVALGNYHSQAQAEAAQAGLEAKFGVSLGLFPASGSTDQIPAE